jgi:hypothetical protein
MADDIPRLIAKLAEAVRDASAMTQQDAYEAATQLRHVADRIQNSSAIGDQRPWWDNPTDDDRLSER